MSSMFPFINGSNDFDNKTESPIRKKKQINAFWTKRKYGTRKQEIKNNLDQSILASQKKIRHHDRSFPASITAHRISKNPLPPSLTPLLLNIPIQKAQDNIIRARSIMMKVDIMARARMQMLLERPRVLVDGARRLVVDALAEAVAEDVVAVAGDVLKERKSI